MKYVWQTAEGTISADIPEEWHLVLVRMDMDEYNSWKKDHRNEDHGNCHRHNLSLDSLDYEGPEFGCDDCSIQKITEATDKELALLDALAALNEQQKKLIDALYYQQKSGKEYAAECGVKPSAITQQKNTVLKKLKKILSEP